MSLRAMRWSIITVRTGKELATRRGFERAGVDAWVPHQTKTWVQRHRRGSMRGKHKRRATFALLPGYVFVPHDCPLCRPVTEALLHPDTGASLSGAWIDLRAHPFVRGVVTERPDEDEPPRLATVTTQEVLQIGARFDQMPGRYGKLDLRPGDRARLLFGILRGQTVTVTYIDAQSARYEIEGEPGSPRLTGETTAASLEPVEETEDVW